MARPKKESTNQISVTSTVQAAKTIGIKPLMGYVLVLPSEAETKTASGLYLPETSQEKPAQGMVVALGDPIFFEGREIIPPVQMGQVIIFKKWGGDEIKHKGVEYKIVKFEDIMAIVTE